jgi:hypothetical protein
MLNKDHDGYQWWDEGLSAIVRILILLWSASILTLNYVTLPFIPEQGKIDPTFIASVFTGTLATFGVISNKDKKKKKEDEDDAKLS